MITAAANYYEIVAQLPAGQVRTFPAVTWEEYEELLEQVGEAAGLRISYNAGTLKVMSLSPLHEKYVRFIESLISQVRFRLRINIISFGSATLRKKKKAKGNEPDACFYVQTAALTGTRLQLDFTIDPPPDVVVEVDIHHASTDNDAIYATLGVAEIWRYAEDRLTILLLQADDAYLAAETSQALPMLTSQILTEYLARLRQEEELTVILAFDEWLQTLAQ